MLIMTIKIGDWDDEEGVDEVADDWEQYANSPVHSSTKPAKSTLPNINANNNNSSSSQKHRKTKQKTKMRGLNNNSDHDGYLYDAFSMSR